MPVDCGALMGPTPHIVDVGAVSIVVTTCGCLWPALLHFDMVFVHLPCGGDALAGGAIGGWGRFTCGPFTVWKGLGMNCCCTL